MKKAWLKWRILICDKLNSIFIGWAGKADDRWMKLSVKFQQRYPDESPYDE